MTKGTGTRSGLLWEVERILNECGQELPQILVMENVPQVIGKNNIEDFKKWELYLESKGYSNYIKCLNSKHYGIPQNRNRCFMVSILGDAYYEFPRKTKLKLTLEDMLEENVDEKYFLSSERIDQISKWNSYDNPLEDVLGKKSTCPTITTRVAISDVGGINASTILLSEKLEKTTNLRIKNATKKGYLEAEIGDGIDISTRMESHRGTVQKGKAQTITTMGGENVGVVVKGNYSPSGHNASRIVDTKGLAPTVMENHGTVTAIETKGVAVEQENNLAIRKLTPCECLRLMGFSDDDYKAVRFQSDACLYKQAGNSIVVNVLMAIFKQLL